MTVGLSGTAKEYNPFLIAQRQLDEAAEIMVDPPSIICSAGRCGNCM
ncbi:MAG: hypothetical protein RMK65_12590 [Anaerolineae bacterium]|nr:hypothetical protein [Anaerolineae bacterium]